MNTVFQITAPKRTAQTAPTSPVQVRTRGFSGTMTYTMHQHPTNIYIIPLKKNFSDFRNKMHEYSVKCFLCETMPQMSNQMTLVSKSFEHFIEVANQFYQGVNLSPRGRTSLHTSALQKAARPLVENWIDFINIMNDVFHRGITQFYSLIPKYYHNLQRDLDLTIASFDDYSYKTDVPAGSIRKLKLEVQKLKVAGQKLCKRCNSSKRKEMESGAYLERAQRYIDRIYKFFNVSVPKQTITSGSVFKVRTKVYTSCGELADVITGAQMFAPLSESVKESIINFNDGLEDLLNKMEFPFCLKLDVEKWDESDSDDDNEKKHTTRSRNVDAENDVIEEDDDSVPLSPEKQIAGDHIDKLKNQLKDIDAKIDEAQEMLKSENKEERLEKELEQLDNDDKLHEESSSNEGKEETEEEDKEAKDHETVQVVLPGEELPKEEEKEEKIVSDEHIDNHLPEEEKEGNDNHENEN